MVSSKIELNIIWHAWNVAKLVSPEPRKAARNVILDGIYKWSCVPYSSSLIYLFIQRRTFCCREGGYESDFSVLQKWTLAVVIMARYQLIMHRKFPSRMSSLAIPSPIKLLDKHLRGIYSWRELLAAESRKANDFTKFRGSVKTSRRGSEVICSNSFVNHAIDSFKFYFF